MESTEQLLSRVKEWNLNYESRKVFDELKDSILEKYNDADLYAEKALACYYLDDIELSQKYTTIALTLDQNCPNAIGCQGHIYMHLNELENAYELFEKSLFLSEENIWALLGFCSYYFAIRSYHECKLYFKKITSIRPDFKYVDYNLGLIYFNERNLKEAKKHIIKAIELNPEDESNYNLYGLIFKEERDYEKAIEQFQIALRKKPELEYPYYNLGIVYNTLNEIENSLFYFEKFIALSESKSSEYFEFAQASISELKKKQVDNNYYLLKEKIKSIKNLLKRKESTLTHYTTFSTARHLIFEKSLFRISEGTFLNDPSEGKAIFNFLAPIMLGLGNYDAIQDDFNLYNAKPFISSFVADGKYNDLTLWRMYGKENKEEAKGVAISIDSGKFLESVKNKLFGLEPEKNIISPEFELEFYQVAYLDTGAKTKRKFHLLDASKRIENDLNKLMTELSTTVKELVTYHQTNKETNKDWRKNLFTALNEISFLFKNADYKDEYEIRLIVDPILGEKKIDRENPRVFIETIDISPMIKKLTLGPKVERNNEWASVFHYHFKEEKLEIPEIHISCLPFK